MSSLLPFGLTDAALAAAMAEPDPGSLSAATRLRRTYGPDLAAAALSQAALRRAARHKFGAAAEGMFFTRAGLEQATRPEVADHRAQRFVAAGGPTVVDLGCGIGADALAFVRAGLKVIAVERDPETAAVAAANLEGRAPVLAADAEQVADDLLTPGSAVFCDPARRTEQTRLWRVEDFSPSWSLVGRLLDGSRTAGIKLGPALPSRFIPDRVEAEWFTHRGDTVEVTLWAGPGASPGLRAALVGPDDQGLNHRFLVAETPELPVRALGQYLYEPAGSVIRAGGVAQLGTELGAGLLDAHLAYLTGDVLVRSPFATAFAVQEQLPYRPKVLRRWVVEHGIGTLEIKKRGVEVDPARLRLQLRLAGPHQATMIISRTPHGAVAVIATRVGADPVAAGPI